MPLRNPQDFSLSLSFGGYQKALSHLQLLRNEIQRFRCYCKQAIVFYFIPRRAAKSIKRKTYMIFMHRSTAVTTRGGAVKVKEFALLTHLGRALMRPRWRSFARVQAPTALKSRREAGFQGVLDPLVRFLGSFFAARQRMNTPSRYSSARGETAQYERPKEKLLKIQSTPCSKCREDCSIRTVPAKSINYSIKSLYPEFSPT